jgi:4-azaleucine resistance transporter AzlC
MDGQELWKGIKAGAPIGLGYVPIAVAFGALAVKAGLTWWEAALMSVLVYAGASQFVGVGMLMAGSGVLQIVVATLILNLRHLVMSLSVNYRMRFFPPLGRKVLSLGITDETFALLTLGGEKQEETNLDPWFTAGILAAAYIGWVAGTAAGALGAGWIPEGITTAITVGLYALFIGLLVPAVHRQRGPAATAAAGMALSALFGLVVGSGWAIVLAALAASGLGVLFWEEA